MPDPTLSGSAAEFIAVFNQVHNQKAWKFFEDLARNGMIVPGHRNVALNPVLSGARKRQLSQVSITSPMVRSRKVKSLLFTTPRKEPSWPFGRCSSKKTPRGAKKRAS